MTAAHDRASSSRMVVAKLSQEFQPMGGVCARMPNSAVLSAARSRAGQSAIPASTSRRDRRMRRLCPPRHCKFKTTIDFAGSVADRVAPVREALEKAAGRTALGISKVLRASIAEAVRTEPLTCLTAAPDRVTETEMALFGSRLTSATAIAPSAVRAADMLIAGTEAGPRV